MGTRAYQQTMRAIESPKDAEARVFNEVTRGLELCVDADYKSENFKNYLFKNQKLWVAVRDSVLSEDNLMAPQLKASIASLGMWVERHTKLVLTGKASIVELIEVNKNMIAGLGGQVPEESSSMTMGA